MVSCSSLVSGDEKYNVDEDIIMDIDCKAGKSSPDGN
jgi:hypothetical protein